jgi:hypothetical protein
MRLRMLEWMFLKPLLDTLFLSREVAMTCDACCGYFRLRKPGKHDAICQLYFKNTAPFLLEHDAITVVLVPDCMVALHPPVCMCLLLGA